MVLIGFADSYKNLFFSYFFSNFNRFFFICRSTWPEDPDRAARGGFVVGRTNAGNPIYRNPAAPHIIPVLPNILSMIKMLNALWTPQALSRLSEVI